MLEAVSLTTAYPAASVHAACCESQHRMLQTADTHLVYNHKPNSCIKSADHLDAAAAAAG